MVFEPEKSEDPIVLASPDTVGAYPIRQDITVLPADDPAKLRLGWVIHERLGIEILPFDPLVSTIEDLERLQPITQEDGIKEGDQIFVHSISGWAVATVARTDTRPFYAETECNEYVLEFDRDDRHCWVSTCQISKAINKVEF